MPIEAKRVLYAALHEPLTPFQQADLNHADTPPDERQRLYVKSLRFTAQSYAIAATAVGLRKDAARYLKGESERLFREADGYERIAAEARARAVATVVSNDLVGGWDVVCPIHGRITNRANYGDALNNAEAHDASH